MTDQNNEHEPERGHEHGYGQVPRHGGWEPVPHGGEYEPDATAFVQLPPDMDMMGAPLAAPGHGYVPPMIVPLTPAAATDPGATGVWRIPTELTGQPTPDADPAPGAQTVVWPEPAAPAPMPATPTEPAHDPAATAQWNFADEPSLAGTGQWTIPVAEGELPEESGEFTTSSLIEQWGSTPPATLPGGAPAPWANQLPEARQPEPQPEIQEPAVQESVVQESAPEPVLPAADIPDVRDVPDAAGSANGAAQQPEPEAVSAAEPLPEGPAAESVPETVEAPGTPEAVKSPEAPEAPEVPQVPQAPESAELPASQPEAEPEPGPQPASEATADPGIVADPAPEPVVEAAPAVDLEHPRASYVLRVNGADRPVTEAWVGESLLYVLRERLGLAGAKDGCSQGECGACNVQVDGRLVASCLVPAATTAGSEVRTVEGLATDGEPSDVQRALAESGAVQCGFCIPGMAMTVHDLLEGNHAPTELETRQALCGNLCRCSGYRGVLDAVKDVVAAREAAGAAPAEEARIPHQAPPGAGSAKPPHTHDGGMA
ncbi:2Fe-2S iron-sulfur cluster-binding protein [Streptomyces violascens]|uniref:(2Fe-2S)-binding protein n=1 Tax=Streptomyces violascens TaxID=67381 RepID=UPI003795BE08